MERKQIHTLGGFRASMLKKIDIDINEAVDIEIERLIRRHEFVKEMTHIIYFRLNRIVNLSYIMKFNLHRNTIDRYWVGDEEYIKRKKLDNIFDTNLNEEKQIKLDLTFLQLHSIEKDRRYNFNEVKKVFKDYLTEKNFML